MRFHSHVKPTSFISELEREITVSLQSPSPKPKSKMKTRRVQGNGTRRSFKKKRPDKTGIRNVSEKRSPTLIAFPFAVKKAGAVC
jgi:hypothetical protein